MTGEGPLGIIAGAGVLPLAVAEAAEASGRPVYVVALSGFADKAMERFDHDWTPISHGSRIIGLLKRRGCRDLVLVGGVRRPQAWLRHAGPSLIWFALRNLDLLAAGDSTVLGRVVRVLERNGFCVRGAHEVAPGLVLPAGALGRYEPDAAAQRNIETGFAIARALGRLDVGQGAVVAGGRVLAVEAAEGTDAMLERVAGLNARKRGPEGVLVKCPQPIQDLRVDMPTIGPETVRRAAEAGLAGIAIVAGRVLVTDADATRGLADELGLFVVAEPGEETGA